MPVGAQAVFARGFFQSDLVFLSASVQAGDKAQVMFVVADDVAGLVFAEGFSPSEQVDGFEERGFAGAVRALDEVDVRVEIRGFGCGGCGGVRCAGC